MKLARVSANGFPPTGADETCPRLGAPWAYAYNPDVTRLLADGVLITSAELNHAAELDWTVVQRSAFTTRSHVNELSIDANGYINSTEDVRFKLVGGLRGQPPRLEPDVLLNVRADTDRVLGIVKQRYRVLQNGQAPHVLDRLVEAGALRYELAGLLRGGAQVWWLAKAGEALVLAGDAREAFEFCVLLSNAHDGSIRTTAAVLPFRLASRSVMTWSLPRVPRSVGVRHTDSARDELRAAGRVGELIEGYQSAFAVIADRMLHAALPEQRFQHFLEALLPTPAPRSADGRTVNQRGITMAESAKGLITTIYWQNEHLQHLVGTVWGLVQACELFSNHLTGSRNTPGATAEENRFTRLTSSTTIGARAFTLALELL